MKNSTVLLLAMFGVASLTSAYESELNDREGRKLGWWKKDSLNLYQRCCMQTDDVLESDESPCTCPNRVEDEAYWFFGLLGPIDVKAKFEESCGEGGSIYRKGNIGNFNNAPGSDTGNIVEVATAATAAATDDDDGFSILLDLAVSAGIATALTVQTTKDGTNQPLTVFAPSNAAFRATGISVADLKTNSDLESILLCHVVVGNFPSSILSDGARVDTLGGSTVTINVNSGVTINGDATVGPADILANNGVIHVIDKVLDCDGGTIVAQD